MAKQKTRPDRTGFLNKLTSNLGFSRNKQAEDERMALLAMEIGLAGGEVLRERHNFTDRQVAEWLDAMIDRAKTNRARMLAQAAINQIDNGK